MRIFAKNSKATQQSKSAKFASPDRRLLRQNHYVDAFLQLQRMIGNQAVQELLYSDNRGPVTGSAISTPSYRFSHDFSRIPLHPKTHTGIQPRQKVEAGRVPDMLMSMPERKLQRAPAITPSSAPGPEPVIRLQAATSPDQIRSAEIPDLPAALVGRMRAAIADRDAGVRQAVIDDLVEWAEANPEMIRVDWSRVESVLYVPSRPGSQSYADNPDAIRVEIGYEPFLSTSDLYSVFRHELTHVVEHQHPERGPFVRSLRSSGLQEIRAYLWELENAENTGLSRRENWGLDSRDQGWNRGLARVVDGLFRNLMTDWQQGVSETELQNINRQFGCAMLSIPREVIVAVLEENAPSNRDLAQACFGRDVLAPPRGERERRD